MTNQWLGLSLLLALSSMPILAEDVSSYRVAGIINLANGDHLAVIEWPSGEQQLLRRGDLLSEGKILEIATEFIRLNFPDGERTLWLRAGNNTAETSATNPPEAPIIVTQEVSTKLRQGLQQLAAESQSGDKPDSGAKLNALFRLPPEARITAINEDPADSAGQTAKMVLERLDKRAMTHLFISGAADVNEVYLALPPEQNEVQ